MHSTNGTRRRGTRLPCADTFDRRSTVGVLPEPATGRLVLAAPPGEAAVLSPDEARRLARQLVAVADALDETRQVVVPMTGRART